MARARDAAGNIGATISGGIFVDTIAPKAASMALAGGQLRTNRQTVLLSMGATDTEPSSGISSVSFSEDGTNWTDWIQFQKMMNYTLQPGDGACTLSCRVRDRALNVAPPANLSFIKDTAPPGVLWFRISSVGERMATVEVALNENSEVQVLYGSSTSYGSIVSSARQSKVHTLELSGLSPGRTYHCRLLATDACGNGPFRTADFILKTKAPPAQSDLFSGWTSIMMAAIVVGIILAVLAVFYHSRSRAGRGLARLTVPVAPPEAEARSPEPPPVPPVRTAGSAGPGPDSTPEDAPGGKLAVLEVVRTEDLDDTSAFEELEDVPPPEKAPPPDGALEEEDMVKLISSLYGGLPSSLWGKDARELVGMVARGERRVGEDGGQLVRLGTRWYHADTRDRRSFLQVYRGR